MRRTEQHYGYEGGGGVMPNSSGDKLELSIMTPMPTFAAFCHELVSHNTCENKRRVIP